MRRFTPITLFNFVAALCGTIFPQDRKQATNWSRGGLATQRTAARSTLLQWAIVAFAFCSVGLVAAIAQTVRWDPPSGQLGFNQVSQLSLVFDNCEPEGSPNLPTIDGVSFGRPSQSSQTSIVNFTMTRTYSLAYPVRPSKRTNVSIPAFEVKTDKGNVRVAAANFTVGDAPVGNSSVSIDDIASAKLTLAKTSFWAGEVFPVTFNLEVVRRYFHSPATNVEWPAAPFVAEDWSKLELMEALVGGERRVVSQQTTRAYTKQAGSFTLNPASQMINLVVGSSGFGLFSQPNVEQRQLDSNSIPVTIKALPPAPAGFSGAVGEFTFNSKVVPTTTGVGEPVTWTIELSGTGNWPDITGLPSRDVSNDFQIVQPKSKRTMKEGSLFEGTLNEDVVLVPTKPGTYQLAPVRFIYFDTKSGSYKTLSSEAVTVTVNAVSSPAHPSTNSSTPQFSITPPPAGPAAPAFPTAVAPVAPENLPRDPLAESAHGRVPFKATPFWLLVSVPALAIALITWLVLAAFRSKGNDVQRLRRAALVKLKTIVSDIPITANQSAKVAPHLREWQQQVAVLWEVPHAAPGASLVQSRIALLEKDAGTEWSTLWTEADRALHSRERNLPQDWTQRADAALEKVRVPGWPPFSLFAPRNLFPFLFTLALLLSPVATQAASYGDSFSAPYKKGEYEAAEKAVRSIVEKSPNDWAARHNLGLVLAQQDRWAEGTAHWTSAFLLNPSSPLTRWDLALGLQRSGMAPPELLELSRGDGGSKFARFASPGQWQIILIVAALLMSAALVLLLLQGYKRIGHWAAPAVLITGLLAVALAACSTLSLHLYGELADPEVALVWKPTVLRSIPTEVDTTQKTSPLSAGSIAVMEKNFLGWTKLNFTGGQSGWVRTEDLIPLYR